MSAKEYEELNKKMSVVAELAVYWAKLIWINKFETGSCLSKAFAELASCLSMIKGKYQSVQYLEGVSREASGILEKVQKYVAKGNYHREDAMEILQDCSELYGRII